MAIFIPADQRHRAEEFRYEEEKKIKELTQQSMQRLGKIREKYPRAPWQCGILGFALASVVADHISETREAVYSNDNH